MLQQQKTSMATHNATARDTSGVTDPVWLHTEPYSNRPQFSKLSQNLETDVCVIGAGVAGISLSYELIKRGHNVVLVEAREVLSGETGRTSGHLSNDIDSEYVSITSKHGADGAKAAAASHTWALNHIGHVAKELGIECEYRFVLFDLKLPNNTLTRSHRHLPGYDISQYLRSDPKHQDDIEELKDEAAKAKAAGLDVEFVEGGTVKGWDGAVDQRDLFVYADQATFHPTKYLNGLLKWLQNQPNFTCYTNTRVMGVEEKGVKILGIGSKHVQITTEDGNEISCKNAVEATCVPLQKLAVIAQMEFHRTYCIAVKVPKGYVEDCLLYDSADPYIYVRLTECDKENDYMLVGGEDHKVGQEDTRGRFEELEKWTRERFTKAGSVDYKWSGQVFEPVDVVAYIGKNQGNDNIYIVTGDHGNGLTHGVIASKLIADEIEGVENPWASLYDPKRKMSVLKSAPAMIAHDLQINSQYKRFLQSDIDDIEDLAPGSGGVLNKAKNSGGPIAVYKDEGGQVFQMSALCPHLKGVVCWNGTEKSWDCPVHGSRFSAKGLCVMGPSKGNLPPVEGVSA